VIRSFHLEPLDGAGLIPHIAGQHLPIRVTLPRCDKPVIRTYTLSTAPSDGRYRISVKNERREGGVSAFLHGTLHIGGIVEARAPAGQFTIDAAERRPAVLLAAGVGVTPMLAMLRHIVYEGLRTRRVRPTWFFHSARSLNERAFSREIAELENAANGAVKVVRTLTRTDGARQGKDFDVAGRIDIELLRKTLPFDDYDFYLCGPSAFMQSLYDKLRDLNVADNRIHAEAFGPSGLRRRKDGPAQAGPVRVAAEQPTPVAFVKSQKEARWSPESGSLLELAEAQGLSPEFSCRGGSCGTCRTRVLAGAVAYPDAPEFQVSEGEALICCAVPAAPESGGGERLLLDL
jgi:ferredoxin-NADP reductase